MLISSWIWYVGAFSLWLVCVRVCVGLCVCVWLCGD